MNINYILILAFLFINLDAYAQPKIKLDTFVVGVPHPVDIANDGYTSRLYIADQSGRIFVYDSNANLLDTFLDIRTKVQYSDEQGFLGITFHPNYQQNGYFFVYYTQKSTTNNVVFRYKVSTHTNRANMDSSFLIIHLPHPTHTNHNGGCMKFGHDGFLYIAVGDGGSGGDPNNNAQNKNSILGKLLRIDVNNFSVPYTIPTSNPFYNATNVRKEIWAYGLRNLWRFSFDRQTHDMWQADVGQGNWEEVNFQASSSMGGENYGWRCYEGDVFYNPNACGNSSNYVFPIFQYGHNSSGGRSITGGFVYRGNRYKDLQGYYLCGDFLTHNFFAIKKENHLFYSFPLGKISTSNTFISSFGEDIYGELYAANLINGIIYKIREQCSTFSLNMDIIQQPTCLGKNDGAIYTSISGNHGLVSYHWNTNDTTSDLQNLLAGTYMITATDTVGCVRKDSLILLNLDTIASPNLYFDAPFLYTSTMADAYFWYKDNVILPTQTNDTLFISENGDYKLEIMDVNGCKSFAELPIILSNISNTTDITIFNVFPNPAKNELHLEIEWLKTIPKYLKINSVLGQLYYENKIQSSASHIQIPLDKFPSGIYFISFLMEDGNIATKSFVVE